VPLFQCLIALSPSLSLSHTHTRTHAHTHWERDFQLHWCTHIRIHIHIYTIIPQIHTYTGVGVYMCIPTIQIVGKEFLAMGWLRSVSSLKLQVSFAEYRLFYSALLQIDI